MPSYTNCILTQRFLFRCLLSVFCFACKTCNSLPVLIILLYSQIRAIDAKQDSLELLNSDYETSTKQLGAFIDSATKVNGIVLLDTIDELGNIVKSRDKVNMANSGIRMLVKLRFAVISGAAYSRIPMVNNIHVGLQGSYHDPSHVVSEIETLVYTFRNVLFQTLNLCSSL